MLGLDHYAPFLLSAFGITLVVLVGYALYLRSRLSGLRRRAASYRERAAQLSIMADAEPIGSLRTELLELAARYAGLAENLEIRRD